jgi:purine-binding chemotaxis protein CheW
VTAVHVKLRVGRESYAMPIENVLEVCKLEELTPIPGAASRVLGVCNFHGQVLPVFDLARVFGIPRDGLAQRLVVTDSGGRLAGFAVDEVSDVTALEGPREEAEAKQLAYATLEQGALVGVVDMPALFSSLGAV